MKCWWKNSVGRAKSFAQFSLFLHPDQAQNTLSGIQGQEAPAVAVINDTAPTAQVSEGNYNCTTSFTTS